MSGEAERSVDVLVAGAGPAGCSAALAAARAGVSVLLVEVKKEPGLPVRCAEFVPRLMAREVEIPDEAIAQPVEEMAVFVREREEPAELGRVRSPGFILHRERFERALAKRAAEAGAELLVETRATPGAEGLVELTGPDGALRLRPKVTIAADGPFSAFRRRGEATACLPAAQFTLRLRRPASWTEVHFARRFRFGYGWVFPKGDLANVGVGCAPEGGRRELVPLLERFADELRSAGKVARDAPLRRTAGWIPTWGPPESAFVGANGDNILFAGDAGGFTDPLTGAGLWAAVATGSLAGECAASAAREGEVSSLSAYDDEWRKLLGSALARSAEARKRMEAEWDSRGLAELVREAWPGL